MEAGNKHTSCIVCGSSNIQPLKGYEVHTMVKCADCCMVFIQKIPTLQDLENHYKNYSYNKEVFVSPVTIKRYNELLDEFEKYRQTGAMLDVGCGVGLFLAVAKQRGWEVYGTEYSEKAVSICEEKGISMKLGKLDASAFRGKQFDIVTSFEVIEHINNPNEELTEINKLLRKGGLFYCTTPNFNSLGRYYTGAHYNIISYPEHLSYYTPYSINFLARKHGFKPLATLTTGISFSRISNSTAKPAVATSAATSKQAKPKPNLGAASTDEKVRQSIEGNKLAGIAKRLANFAFNITGTGSALKAYFIKPE